MQMLHRVPLFLLLILISPAMHTQQAYKAIVTVPVADLVGAPIATLMNTQNTRKGYESLPHSSATGWRTSCPRIHQLLFNDIVDVLQTQNDEVKVQISSAFYAIDTQKAPQTIYWMRKDALIRLDSLSQQEQERIPLPMQYQHPASVLSSEAVTLLYPWHDALTGMTFSAGTRFVVDQEKSQAPYKTRKYIPVWRFNPATTTSSVMKIPAKKCIIHAPSPSPQQCIQNFVRIVRSWANQSKGIIPYVLGGTSFTQLLPDVPYTRKPLPTNPQLYCYIRNQDTKSPKGGLDCTGIVLRAAQMAGIPYFLKNTKTIELYLQPLEHHQPLENGDLILIQGHVLIISDTSRNLAVEARSYDHGYGKVQELPLCKIFNGITTCDDLLRIYYAKSPVDRLDSKGDIRDHFPQIKIMRMASAYTLSSPALNEDPVRLN